MSLAPEAIKAGGSLARAGLPPVFVAWLKARPAPAALIPGGGEAADAVRAWQRVHGLGDPAAHWLAVRAMGLSAGLWAELLQAPRAESFDECRRMWAGGARLAVLDPYAELRAEPAALPQDWSATSDSIAAWAARRLGASRLTLCKAVGPPATIAEAVARDWLDPCFPAAAAGLEVQWLNALAPPDPRPLR